jgi:hypothetical protein
MKLLGLFQAGVATPMELRLAIAMAIPVFLVGSPWSAVELACLAGVAGLSFFAAAAYVAGTSIPLREEAS